MRNNRINTLAVISALALAAAPVAHAQYVMTNSDSLGNSSFNSAGNWNSGAAPVAGSTYTTGGWLLRSPSSGSAYTFAGDSLTIGNGSGAAAFSTVTANNNALIFKVASQTLTVNNLIANGSQIRDGLGNGQWAALDGNITVMSGGVAFIAQDTNIINSTLAGTGTIYIGDNGNGSSQRVIEFTSGLNTFTGNFVFNNTHSAANYSQAWFTPGSLMNFVIGANGVNNGISGQGTLELSGNIAFNLTGADNTTGDSWDIVDPTTTVTYDPTFDVLGFTQNGTLWDDTVNGADYEFNEMTGQLTVVPEPSSLALLGMGSLGSLFMLRRKK